MYVFISACICIYIYINICCMHLYMYVGKHVHACMYVYVCHAYDYACVCMYVCRQTYFSMCVCSRPFSSKITRLVPCSTGSFTSYTQRHTFKDHFMKNGDSTAKTTNMSRKRKILTNVKKNKLNMT